MPVNTLDPSAPISSPLTRQAEASGLGGTSPTTATIPEAVAPPRRDFTRKDEFESLVDAAVAAFVRLPPDQQAMAKALANPTLTAAERGAAIAQTSGAMRGVIDNVVAVLRQNPGALEAGAAKIAPALQEQGWSFAQALPGGAKMAEKVIANPANPVERLYLDASLDLAAAVLRTAVNTEAIYLDRLAIPPQDVPKVRAAVTRYALGVTSLIQRAYAARGTEPANVQFTDEHREALRQGLGTMLAPDQTLDPAHADTLVDGLQAALSAGPMLATGLPRFEASASQELDRLNAELATTLRRDVKLSPESQAAFDEIATDARLMLKYATNITRIYEITNNADGQLSAGDANELQRSIEAMGTVPLKLLQTVLSFLKLAKNFSQKGIDAEKLEGSVLGVMKRIEGSVTPMSEERVRAQMAKQFPGRRLVESDPGQGPASFVWFDFKPRSDDSSGSMGQGHLSAVRDPDDPTGKRILHTWSKVMRDGMDADFADANRAAKLLVRMTESLTAPGSADASPSLLDGQKQFFTFAQTMLTTFIDTFKLEMEGELEAQNSTRASRDARSIPGIYVPRFHKPQSGRLVITQDYVQRSWSQEDHLAHYQTAQVARRMPPLTTPLGDNPDGLNARDDAEARALLWGRQTYGMPAERVEVLSGEDGTFAVALHFQDRVFPKVQLYFDASGKITTPDDQAKPPAYTAKELEKLTANLLAGVVNGFFRQSGHGDLQAKNYMIMPDGVTVALIDWGMTLRPKLRDFLAPVRLLVGCVLQNKDMMARAMVDMSVDRPKMTFEERVAAAKRVKAKMDELDSEPRGSSKENPFGELTRMPMLALTTMIQAGLAPSGFYMMALKSAGALAGNLSELVLTRDAIAARGIAKTVSFLARDLSFAVFKDIRGQFGDKGAGLESAKLERLRAQQAVAAPYEDPRYPAPAARSAAAPVPDSTAEVVTYK